MIIGVKDRLDALLPVLMALACKVNTLGSKICHLPIDQHGGNCPARANEVTTIEPLPHHPHNLTEQMKRRRLSMIPKTRVHEVLGKVERDAARPDIVQYVRPDLDTLTDNSLKQHSARSNEF